MPRLFAKTENILLSNTCHKNCYPTHWIVLLNSLHLAIKVSKLDCSKTLEAHNESFFASVQLKNLAIVWLKSIKAIEL